MRKSLTKQERLKKSSDIKRVFSSPLRQSTRGGKLVYCQNGSEIIRFTVSLTRKFGTAVERNRAKRQLREIYRIHKEEMVPGWDLIFVLYPGEYDYGAREQQFFSLIQRASLKKEPF